MPLRGVIFDLDGTVYRGSSLLPGVPDAIDEFRAAGLELLFFSNNPTKDGSAYVDRLREFGLDVRAGEACSAGVATSRYLRDNHADDPIMLVGSDGLREQLLDAGLRLTADPDEAAVLVGSWTPSFNYGDMQAALQAVEADTVFLGTDPDRTFPQENGRIIPGSGAIVDALAGTVGRGPDAFMGKPSDAALSLVAERLGVPLDECLVVGDRLSTDLAMGERAGMTTVLVLTGISRREDIRASDVEPDYVIENLGEIDSVLADLEGQGS
jgi:4-nitrophenyl phosphatase